MCGSRGELGGTASPSEHSEGAPDEVTLPSYDEEVNKLVWIRWNVAGSAGIWNFISSVGDPGGEESSDMLATLDATLEKSSSVVSPCGSSRCRSIAWSELVSDSERTRRPGVESPHCSRGDVDPGEPVQRKHSTHNHSSVSSPGMPRPVRTKLKRDSSISKPQYSSSRSATLSQWL